MGSASHVMGCHRVRSPAHECVLRRVELVLPGLRVGILSLHVLTENMHGVGEVLLESTHVLALPEEAASEVIQLFARLNADVRRYFDEHVLQPQPAGLLGTVQRSLGWLLSSRADAQPADVGRTEPTSRLVPLCTCQQRPQTSKGPCAVCLHSMSSSDPISCYTFEHYFVPFMRQWASTMALASLATPVAYPQGVAPPVRLAGTADLPAVADAHLTTARRLLGYLTDQEMWSCTVLLLDSCPVLSEEVVRLGMETPGDTARLPPGLGEQLVGRTHCASSSWDTESEMSADGILAAIAAHQQNQQHHNDRDERLIREASEEEGSSVPAVQQLDEPRSQQQVSLQPEKAPSHDQQLQEHEQQQ